MGKLGAALVWIAAGVSLAEGAEGPLLLPPASGDSAPRGKAEAANGPGNVAAPKDGPASKPAADPGPKVRFRSAKSQVLAITIRGRALDGDGKPVARASIFVTDANPIRYGDPVLGRALTGADGRFTVRDAPLRVLPPGPGSGAGPRPAEARFEVAGSAPGLGFTWHALQS